MFEELHSSVEKLNLFIMLLIETVPDHQLIPNIMKYKEQLNDAADNLDLSEIETFQEMFELSFHLKRTLGKFKENQPNPFINRNLFYFSGEVYIQIIQLGLSHFEIDFDRHIAVSAVAA